VRLLRIGTLGTALSGTCLDRIGALRSRCAQPCEDHLSDVENPMIDLALFAGFGLMRAIVAK
jgi:hypothetical protein